MKKRPVIGEKIYIPSSFHISRGSDDVCGGLATINKIDKGDIGNDGDYYFEVKEVPNSSYNYSYIMELQKELKKEFGKEKAHPDPDIDTPWIESGDSFNEGKYKGSDIW